MIYMMCDNCNAMSEFTRMAEDGTAHQPKESFLLVYREGRFWDTCSIACAKELAEKQGWEMSSQDQRALKELGDPSRGEHVPEKAIHVS